MDSNNYQQTNDEGEEITAQSSNIVDIQNRRKKRILQTYDICFKGIDKSKIQLIILPESLKEIRKEALNNFPALQAIDIPNTVTTIGQYAFSGCKQLQTVTLPQDLTEIEEGTFQYCTSLQSINIPHGVIKIGKQTFEGCTQLQRVILPQTLKHIEVSCFDECTSLQSITIPESVTRIKYNAFRCCSALEVIALPQSAQIDSNLFPGSKLLNNKLKCCNINRRLQTRFDDLPLHQLCYNINYTTLDMLASIQINDQALTAKDVLGMTPLHILCSNPLATPDMIKHLVSKNHDVAHAKNIYGTHPLHMYLISKCVISHDDLQHASKNKFNDVSPVTVVLLQDGTKYDINKMIDMGLEYDVIDVVMTLNGMNIGAKLGKKNKETGLYPFMSGAISHQYKLTDVYMMTKESVNYLIDNETLSGKKRKRVCV